MTLTADLATKAVSQGMDVYEVRRGTKRYLLTTDYEKALDLALEKDADIFDWETGDYA